MIRNVFPLLLLLFATLCSETLQPTAPVLFSDNLLLMDEASEDAAQKLEETGDEKSTQAASVFVDEELYLLGSGDELTAYLWGLKDEVLKLEVTNEGKVIIPTVGSVEVNKVPLKEAKKEIARKIKTKYKVSSIDITLSEVKRLKVPVFGAVEKEKVYFVSGATRLSGIIEKLKVDSVSSSQRFVEIHNDNAVSTYDLFAIRHLIDSAKDPYLFSGDKIFIPYKKDIISISGAVNVEGHIDFVGAESINDIIELSGGYARGADSNHIIVTRFDDDIDSLTTFEPTGDQLETFQLQKDDRIYVGAIPNYRKHRSVTITGEVNYPGTYSIRDDKTRLVEIIGKAGGLTDKAYLEGSRIVRTNFVDAGFSEYARLYNIEYTELSPEEKNYLKYRQTTTSNVVSIDFNTLKKSGEERDPDELNVIYDMILRDGDKIQIAQRGLSVNVMGAVVIPGLVKYKEGANLDYYIKLAGGFKQGAKKRDLKIIKGGTEIWLKPKEVDRIEVGDAIWIPEKEYVDGMKRVRDIITIISGVAMVITASVTVMNYANNN